MYRAILVLVLLGCLNACSGESDKLDVPPASDNALQPEGFAWWSRAAIDAYARFSVWRGERSGYIVMLARDGVPLYSKAVGWQDIEKRLPLTVDTQVNIASMTKPIAAVAAMILIERGMLGLDDRVSSYIPEFADLRVAVSEEPGEGGGWESKPAEKVMRIRHLLMFSSGIGPGLDTSSALVNHWNEHSIYKQASGDLDARVVRLAQLPLLEEPGTRWRYGYSADVLAVVVERVSGQSIAEFFEENIFQPLGMKDTRYPLPETDLSNVATIYTQNSEGDLVLANEWVRDWTPGGGGLLSTVGDYMRFALMLYNGGEYQGERILLRSTVEEMIRLHVPAGVLADGDVEGIGWGLGMAVVADEEASITPDRTGDYWWSGYYGTTFVVSPSTGLVAVAISQNEPSEFSGLPTGIYIIQGIAYAGM
ncbi:MAG: serine hydrolase domain-containing protein [Pseudomonadota bacterium]